MTKTKTKKQIEIEDAARIAALMADEAALVAALVADKVAVEEAAVKAAAEKAALELTLQAKLAEKAKVRLAAEAAKVRSEEKTELGFQLFGWYVAGFEYDLMTTKQKEEEYMVRKTRLGLAAFDALGADGQASRLDEARVRCECVVFVAKKGRKSLQSVADKKCPICRGSSRRVMTSKERCAFDDRLRNERRHAAEATKYDLLPGPGGDKPWVAYVCDSTDMMSEKGYWSPPRHDDGYAGISSAALSPSLGAKAEGPKEMFKGVTVKVYKGRTLVEERVENVMLTPPPDNVLPEWRLLRSVMAMRKKELKLQIDASDTPEELKSGLRRFVWLLTKTEERMVRFGDAERTKGVLEALTDAQVLKVKHLWEA